MYVKLHIYLYILGPNSVKIDIADIENERVSQRMKKKPAYTPILEGMYICIYMCVSLYVFVCVCLYGCVCVYIHVSKNEKETDIYTNIRRCVYVYIYINICIFVFVFVCICIRM
jgi:hypothetical protein